MAKKTSAALPDDTLDIYKELEGIVKVNAISLSSEDRLPTGLLGLDLILGGGIAPSLTIFSGPEQSAKTTAAITVMGSNAANPSLKFKVLWDAENSSGSSTDYVANIFETMGYKTTVEELFGTRKNGKWETPPIVYYRDDYEGDKFFDWLHALQKRLPDKRYESGKWWYVYDRTKENISKYAGVADRTMGANNPGIWVSAPDGGLQALIILDSFPSLVPALMDEEGGTNAMAIQARMFSKHLPRVKGAFKAKRIALLGINQLRQKPGVMYGCYHGGTLVTMADGTKVPIHEVVKKKLQGPVLAYNPSSQAFEPKAITGWHDNGPSKSWLKIKYQVGRNSAGSRESSIIVTPDHLMWSADYKTLLAAKHLRPGNTLVAPATHSLSSQARQLILGMMLGDGWFSSKDNWFNVSFFHKEEHSWLVDWKKSLLPAYENRKDSKWSKCNYESSWLYDSQLASFLRYRKDGCEGHQKRLDSSFVEALDLLALAVWYMDDGAKSSSKALVKLQSYPYGDVQLLCEGINKKFGTNCVVKTWKDPSSKITGGIGYGIKFDLKLMYLIAPYVHPNFKEVVVEACRKNSQASGVVNEDTLRKKSPKYVKYFGEFSAWEKCSLVGYSTVVINSIEKLSGSVARQYNSHTGKGFYKGDSRYEITVADLGLFVADGIVAKNSPDYEPGGQTLAFLSDVRVRLKPRVSGMPFNPKIEKGVETEPSVTGDGTDTYRYIHAHAIKNKLSVPNRETWMRIWVSDGNGEARGYDPVWDTLFCLEQTGQISGKRRAFKLNLKGMGEAKRTITYEELKVLVLCGKEEWDPIYKKIGYKTIDIRKGLINQMRKGVCEELFIAKHKESNKAKSKEEQDEDDDE